jgi:hypothetical protein
MATRRRASPNCDRSGGEADRFGLTPSWIRLYGCAVVAGYACFLAPVRQDPLVEVAGG